MRSEFVRDIAAGVFSTFERYSFGYEFSGEEMKKRADEFIQKGRLGGKIFQLESFKTDKYLIRLEELTKNFLTKEWIVYVSESKNFITSDNPGFSFTHSERNQLLNLSPVFGDYNTNIGEFVVHCYPLTSKMCLSLRPFNWRLKSTEEKIRSDVNKEIQFEIASERIVESINDCSIKAAHKISIGNLEADLHRYLKK
jgi:hypothetical protein